MNWLIVAAAVALCLLSFASAYAARSRSRHRPLRFEWCEQRAMLTLPYVIIGVDGAEESETDEIWVTVSIDPPSDDPISVDFAITSMTANQLATPGEDFYL